ncbi:RICIN domain-containing protein, partial [Pseudofrankia sp. BMG5.36]|uniref:RICIN domain-containing protein n=1 Tax=Pseudofrankia sp. BMG5.36 TaxID=1834512 RepID=UPI0018E2B6AE
TCNGGAYQRWKLTVQSDGSYQLRNEQSGLCIGDSVSQGLRHNTCNGGAYQRWYR